MQWLAGQGAKVALPLGHSPDWDLIAELDGELLRVQVKTSTFRRKGRWEVMVATRGGNQSWNGRVKLLDPSRYDALFIQVGDGRRWFIPSRDVCGGSGIRLDGPKYEAFELPPGPPLEAKPSRSTIAASTPRGDVRVVKGVRL